ncbi:hypothetical protein [Azospirillum sp. A39]|uniref:hypothetical protein n=1 Tax=Azospirillum sp. A39 TaxID=3462279 RepID=UPI004046673A
MLEHEILFSDCEVDILGSEGENNILSLGNGVAWDWIVVPDRKGRVGIRDGRGRLPASGRRTMA